MKAGKLTSARLLESKLSESNEQHFEKINIFGQSIKNYEQIYKKGENGNKWYKPPIYG